MCVRLYHGPSIHGSQKRALDPLEVELQTVGSHHVGAGGKPGSSAGPASAL